MAICTTFDFFRVVNAGNNNLNGFYYPSEGHESLGFSMFSYLNQLTGYPRLEVFNLSGSSYVWGLFTAPNLSAYRTSQIYSNLQSVPDCPHSLSWVYGTQTTGTYPSIAGKTVLEAHRELVNFLYSGSAPIGAVLENGSVTSDKIANGSVTTSKLGDSSVTKAKLANKSVSFLKLTNELRDAVDYNHSPAFPQGFSPIW